MLHKQMKKDACSCLVAAHGNCTQRLGTIMTSGLLRRERRMFATSETVPPCSLLAAPYHSHTSSPLIFLNSTWNQGALLVGQMLFEAKFRMPLREAASQAASQNFLPRGGVILRILGGECGL